MEIPVPPWDNGQADAQYPRPRVTSVALAHKTSVCDSKWKGGEEEVLASKRKKKKNMNVSQEIDRNPRTDIISDCDVQPSKKRRKVSDQHSSLLPTVFSSAKKPKKNKKKTDLNCMKHEDKGTGSEAGEFATEESFKSEDLDARFPLHESVKKILSRGTTDKKKRHLSEYQEKMAKQLQGAHFRMINEELYTSTSQHALRLFERDPSLFDAYHAGFRLQARTWPQNPLQTMIRVVKKHPRWRVADMGCGEALLAQSVGNLVHSFDLVQTNPHVTVADISRLPLGDASVDCVVLCLALMGINYHQFLREANRVLVSGGTLLLAEVRSRVDPVLPAFHTMLKELGFDQQSSDSSNKMFLQLVLIKHRPPLANLSAPPKLKACTYKKR